MQQLPLTGDAVEIPPAAGSATALPDQSTVAPFRCRMHATSHVQNRNGKFHGTTVDDGAHGDGTVYSLSVGLGPFVETQPTSGKVGTPVNILGTNLTSATRVRFNGTKAVFKASSSLIKTRVPTGATTGKVKVTTPHGTLTSNVNFRVIP